MSFNHHTPSSTATTKAMTHRLSSRYSSCTGQPDCTPATPKQTMIIAICFGVAMFLLLILVLWWYRCCCCIPRKGDKRPFKQRVTDGFFGWSHGGQRPGTKTDEEYAEEARLRTEAKADAYAADGGDIAGDGQEGSENDDEGLNSGRYYHGIDRYNRTNKARLGSAMGVASGLAAF